MGILFSLKVYDRNMLREGRRRNILSYALLELFDLRFKPLSHV